MSFHFAVQQFHVHLAKCCWSLNLVCGSHQRRAVVRQTHYLQELQVTFYKEHTAE